MYLLFSPLTWCKVPCFEIDVAGWTFLIQSLISEVPVDLCSRHKTPRRTTTAGCPDDRDQGEGPFPKVDGHSNKTDQKMETDYTDFKRQFCHNWRSEAHRVEPVMLQRCFFSSVILVLVSGRWLVIAQGLSIGSIHYSRMSKSNKWCFFFFFCCIPRGLHYDLWRVMQCKV